MQFATAPTKSNVFPAPGGSSSLPPPPPPKARKSITRRILSPLLLLTVAFYGVSVPLGYFSLRYRDFLVETVPGGEQLGDLLDELQVSRAKGAPNASAPGAPKGPGKETELTRWAESRARAEGWKVKKPEPTDPETARLEIKERLAAEAKKVEGVAKGKVTDIVEAAKARASEVKQVAVKAEGVVEDKAKQAVHAAKDAARAAPAAISHAAHSAADAASAAAPASAPRVVDEPASTLPVYAQRPRELDATPIPPKRASNEVYQGPPLPIGFEPAPGYELPRAAPAPKGELKPVSPPPPPLPLVAPALKDVTVSEPVLGQLAATIDSLAQYVEKHDDGVASASATTVLSGAQKDIKSLAARIEGIKKQEEDKLQAQLKEQASKYSGMLVKAEKDLVDRLDTQEEDWKRAFDDERERLVKAYKDKLDTELATQQELINQRLKEEVIQQGIELQRRWVSEVKTRVEQERGGRLAKLEELETGVRKLEKVARENEDVRLPSPSLTPASLTTFFLRHADSFPRPSLFACRLSARPFVRARSSRPSRRSSTRSSRARPSPPSSRRCSASPPSRPRRRRTTSRRRPTRSCRSPCRPSRPRSPRPASRRSRPSPRASPRRSRRSSRRCRSSPSTAGPSRT